MNVELAKAMALNCDGVLLYGNNSEEPEQYSGRGMYGKRTAALVYDDIGDLLSAFVCITQLKEAGEVRLRDVEIEHEASRIRIDQLGKGYVAY